MTFQIAPSFLAAPPNLTDPNFQNALIAVAMHQSEGAMGFILSRKTELSFHELLNDLSIEPKIEDRRVLYGGPVSKTSGFLLYEHAKHKPLASGLVICDTMSITPSRELLEQAAAGQLPGRFELILGYSGWGPGQLETELSKGGWLHTPVYPELIFDIPLGERWQHAFSQVCVSPLAFISVPGGAQA